MIKEDIMQNNPIKSKQKAIAVRLDPDTHKAFTHRLIDDEMSAQEFFSQAVQKYLNDKRSEKGGVKMLNYTSADGYLVEWGTDIMVLDDPIEIVTASNIEDYLRNNNIAIDDIKILWRGKAQSLPKKYHEYAI